MQVATLAETRVGDRVYSLDACKAGFTGDGGAEKGVSYRVEIVEDREGAGTHDRVIVAQHYAASRFQAEGIHRAFVEIALHHGVDENPFD